MRPVVYLVLALVASALGGCLSGDAPSATTTRGPEALDKGIEGSGAALDGVGEALAGLADLAPENVSIDAPRWAVGDAWTVSAMEDGASSESHTLVVAAATASGYTLATTSERYAMYDALFDMSYIGSIRGTDLAGSQQDSPVKFFDFPLRDGKTWSTAWDGEDVRIVATFNRAIATPAGTQPGFDIVATLNDQPYATYDYVPALRWWSQIHFAEGYGFRVESTTTNWTGTVLQGVAEELLTLDDLGHVARTPAGSFTVDAEQSALALMITGWSEHQARAIAITDPAGQLVPLSQGNDVVVDPNPRFDFVVERLPPTAGTWHVALAMAHDPEAQYDLAFHQVAFEQKTL